MADAGPSRGFFAGLMDRLRKKRRGDIDLPMPPGGRRDPRLPKVKKSSSMFESPEHTKKVREGFGIVSSLVRKSRER